LPLSLDPDAEGWHHDGVDDRCYKISNDMMLQNVARSICQDEGAELVSIIDAEEKNFLKSRFCLIIDISY
jgi:hypothetical protein